MKEMVRKAIICHNYNEFERSPESIIEGLQILIGIHKHGGFTDLEFEHGGKTYVL